MKTFTALAVLAATLSSHATDPYIPLDGAGSDILLKAVQVRTKRALSGTSVVSLGYAYDTQAQAALDHGDCLVWLEVEVENLGVSGELQVLASDFRLVTFDNVSHSYESSQRQVTGHIQRGEIARGGLLFAIPTNSTPSTLRFQPEVVLRSPIYGDVDISATIPVQLRWNGTDFIKDTAYWRERWNEANPRWQVGPRAPAGSTPESQRKPDPAAALKNRQAQERLVAWHFQQASNGVARSQYLLGLCYLTGDGVESNRLEAIRWLGAAAAQDYLDAKELVRTNLIVKPK